MGSILFAIQHLGCRLVIVLGHSRCSVVASAVQSWARQQSSGREEQSVRTLAEGVQQTLSSGSSASHISPPQSEVSLMPSLVSLMPSLKSLAITSQQELQLIGSSSFSELSICPSF